MAVPAPLARRTRRPRAGRRLTGHGVVLHSSLMPAPQRYSVVVAKDYLKFSAAHFIAYPGFREPLHGHNYQVSVRVDAELGPGWRTMPDVSSNWKGIARPDIGALWAARTAQRARLLELKDSRNEFTVLRRNVESAERAYDTAMQRHVVSQVESRASQTNVTVLNPAAVPGKPSLPKIPLNIALSVVVGTMLGIGMVVLMEMIDRRVRSRNDLNLDVPLLVVLNAWQPAANRLLGPPSGTARALPNPG